LLDFRSYFSTELNDLEPLAVQGLVNITASGITVTPQGWFFVRAVAMVFDRYLQSDRTRAQFSKII
jgi:oxygen-independent coproporphyrinogen-3 oxidase